MKKYLSYILAIAMMLSLLIIPKSVVRADASVAISVSKSTISVGESVTVTVSVPSGYAASGYISTGGSDVWTSSGDVPFSIGDAAGQPASASFTYTAQNAGSATFTAVVGALGDSEGNPISTSNPSASVTVENVSVEAPAEEEQKSNDNFLASIVLSNGTLSPAFKYTTTSYTATVPYSVTSVAVTANTSSAAATIKNLTGNTNLQVGENTVTIEVQAEDGTVRKYTIVITRKAESDEDETDEDEPETVEGPSNFEYDGIAYEPMDEIPEDIIPSDFELASFFIGDTEYPCLEFTKGDLEVLYLSAEGEEGAQLFVYDRELDRIYPFVKLATEQGYVIVLCPNDESLLDGFRPFSLSIEGYGVVEAYQFPDTVGDPDADGEGANYGFLQWLMPETVYADEPVAEDFCLIYCMNNEGEKSWYQYDMVEGTYQRYFEREVAPEETEEVVDDSEEYENLQNDYNQLLSEFESFEKKATIVGAIGALIILVLLISLIAVIVSKKKRNKYDMDDLEDFDDEYDDEDYDDEDEVETSEANEEETSSDEVISLEDEADVSRKTPVVTEINPLEYEETTEAEKSDVSAESEVAEEPDEKEEAAVEKAILEQDDLDIDLLDVELDTEKAKFDTIDLTAIADALEEIADDNTVSTIEIEPEHRPEPKPELVPVEEPIEEVSPVVTDDDDDDFEFLDL